jgi:hypothetical protein
MPGTTSATAPGDPAIAGLTYRAIGAIAESSSQ